MINFEFSSNWALKKKSSWASLLNSFYFRVAIWWYSCLNCLNLHLGGFSWVHLLWWYKVLFGWFNPWWKASPCKIGFEFHVSAANFPSANVNYLLLLFCPYVIANFILRHSLSLSLSHTQPHIHINVHTLINWLLNSFHLQNCHFCSLKAIVASISSSKGKKKEFH